MVCAAVIKYLLSHNLLSQLQNINISQHFQQQPGKFSVKMRNQRSRDGWSGHGVIIVWCWQKMNLSFYMLTNKLPVKWNSELTVAVRAHCWDRSVLQPDLTRLDLTAALVHTHCPQHFSDKPVHNALRWRNNILRWLHTVDADSHVPPWSWTMQHNHIRRKHTAIKHYKRHTNARNTLMVFEEAAELHSAICRNTQTAVRNTKLLLYR